ncbi:MAG: DUF4960 domain-containing protein [Prevotella sp.]|nr:DUF4960 domain-containing protein [Prevotella sp.]
MKKNLIKYVAYMLIALPLGGVGGGLLTSCQDKDLPGSGEMKVASPDVTSITGALSGENNYDYTLSWPASTNGAVMNVAVYKNGTQMQALTPCPSGSFTLKNLETNQLYEFLFKYATDDAQSNGVMTSYTRLGATTPSEVKMEQVDITDEQHNLQITWSASPDATSYILKVVKNSTETVVNTTVNGTSYLLENVQMKDRFEATVIAQNNDGKALPVEASAKIGGKVPGFLSEYATPEELIANGDDDEASAWLWFHENYPKGEYIYFGNISTVDDIADYRMLFWLRDIETGSADDVWNFSDLAKNAAPCIEQYVKNGGNLLLWSHAVPYIGTINRLSTSLLRGVDNAFGCGVGGYNSDVWKMGVCLNTGSFYKDFSTHAIYAGIPTEKLSDACPVGIAMKGAGWTEDHNCLFFNIPNKLTGLDNTSEECYNALTNDYGIYPLGTWDSQVSWVSQLNIWEARGADKAPEGFQKGCGTVLCIGNGGCEFSMKNEDGTPDKSASPKNNSCQQNVLKLAKNSIEYLMSI